MAMFLEIDGAKIIVSQRLHFVDADHAKIIALYISAAALRNQLTLCPTPHAIDGHYRLIACAQHVAPVNLLIFDKIAAVLIRTDKANAALLIVAEQLFGHALSALDRAIFVRTYRDLWKKKHGETQADRLQKDANNLGNVCPIFKAAAESDSQGLKFSSRVAKRIRPSKEAIKLLNRRRNNLQQGLRSRLLATPLANNKARLPKIVKAAPSGQHKQHKLAPILEEKGGDFKAAFALIGTLKHDATQQIDKRGKFTPLTTRWPRLSAATRQRFLGSIARGGHV